MNLTESYHEIRISEMLSDEIVRIYNHNNDDKNRIQPRPLACK